MAESNDRVEAPSPEGAISRDENLKQQLEKLKGRPRLGNRAADFITVYSNSMSMESTFNDFKLVFGQIAEATPERLVTDEKVAVIMSPEEAKSVAKVLVRQLKVYEKMFGPIRELPE
jgi:uncharacterized protein DUF3467